MVGGDVRGLGGDDGVEKLESKLGQKKAVFIANLHKREK